MAPTDSRIKRRVWVGLVVAGVGVGTWLVWHQTHPIKPATEMTRPQPFVQLAGTGGPARNQILQEKAELMDPTPLFFPTPWNYGQQPLAPEMVKQPGQVFGSFEARFPLSEKGIGIFGTDSTAVPEKLAELLAQGNEAPFDGMGRIDIQRSTLPIRSGYLEVRGLDSSDLIISYQLSGISPPRADIAPIEFLVVVGRAGLIGEPILTSGSGWDEVDSFFSNYLVKTYRLGERLHPGRYRVVVGS